MEKSAAVVADSLGITKGIDLMKDAGKATGGMMKVLARMRFPHRLLFDVISTCTEQLLLLHLRFTSFRRPPPSSRRVVSATSAAR
jgi:hypothetical protein